MGEAPAETPAQTYERLLRLAKDDPRVIGFILGGSRAAGHATQWSDYDCVFIVEEDAYAAFKSELGLAGHHDADWRPGIDLVAMTLPMLEATGAWDSADRGFRYMFAHMKALVDKTGQLQPIINAKPCVPEREAHGFVAASLDHALNQLYRAAKCLRDGDPDASRLEAAEAVAPFLDALFAIHDRRLRPYYKYLRLELRERPLARSPYSADELIALLTALVAPGGVFALQRLMAETEPMFRAAGHGETYDAWGSARAWMLTWRP